MTKVVSDRSLLKILHTKLGLVLSVQLSTKLQNCFQVSEIRRHGKSWENWKCLVRLDQAGALSLVLSPIVQCYGYIS